MRFWHVLALAILAGCEPPIYTEPAPEPLDPLPDVPEVVLRVPPDFTFRDYETGKQYFVRRYTIDEASAPEDMDLLGGEQSSIAPLVSEGELRLEVVTVLDPKRGEERLADGEEREYALDILEQDCLQRDRQDLLNYHRDLRERERRMRADLLDERIRLKEAVLTDLREERLTLNADLMAIRGTSGYKPPEGRVGWLTLEILRRDVLIADATADLQVLKAQRAVRDAALIRSSSNHNVHERIPIQDIVDGGLSADELIELVKQEVYPESWKHLDSVIRYEAGCLEVSNTPRVVEEVREYVDDLR